MGSRWSLPADKGQFTLPVTFQFRRGTSPFSLYRAQYSPSDSLRLKTMSTHYRFFLSLRAAFFSSSSNINAIAANCLLENEWRYISDGNNRRPPITCCSGRWLTTRDTVNTDHSDGTKMERWRNGNVTHSVNRPLHGENVTVFYGSFAWVTVTGHAQPYTQHALSTQNSWQHKPSDTACPSHSS